MFLLKIFENLKKIEWSDVRMEYSMADDYESGRYYYSTTMFLNFVLKNY